MLPPSRLRSALLAAIVLPLALTGCSGSGSKNSNGSTSAGATADAGPALVSTGGGGGVCLQKVTGARQYGFWNGGLTAQRALTINAVTLNTDSKVSVDGGLAAKVVRRPHQNPGTGISDWPIGDPGRLLRRQLDWPARTGLVKDHLDAKEQVVAFYHLHASPGMSMTTITLAYTTDNGETGTTTITAPLRFSAGGC